MDAKPLKYSRQREAVKNFLMSRKDHPTAEVVYANVRKDFPHISLGTVYRNLSLLVDLGEAIKFPTGDGYEHFDYDTSPHYHFVCDECGAVIDIKIPVDNSLDTKASNDFDGLIKGHSTIFYGLCPKCKQK